MKILFIKKHYNPFGGAERYLALVAKHLKEQGNEIYLLTRFWKKSEGFKVINIGYYPFFFSNIGFALKAKHIAQKFKNFIIFSFERTLYQHIYRASDGCHLRWLSNRKKYLDSYLKSLSFSFNPKHISIRWLEKKCLKNSKIIITNSYMVKNDFKYFYGEEISQKCKVIYNGIDLNIFKPVNDEYKKELRKKLNIPLNGKILVFIGSGYFRKGLLYLIDLIKDLSKEYFLIVVGKEKKIKFFKDRVKDLKIENRVFFLGRLENTVTIYQAGDIFVLPTIYDPFSNACLEAMACGLPVITTFANGAGEIVIKHNAGSVINLPPKKESILEEILKISQDLPKFKIAARKAAENYSIENSIKKLLNIFEKFKSKNLY